MSGITHFLFENCLRETSQRSNHRAKCGCYHHLHNHEEKNCGHCDDDDDDDVFLITLSHFFCCDATLI